MDKMQTRVRPRKVLKSPLEVDIITSERAYDEIYNFLDKRRVEHHCGVHRWCTNKGGEESIKAGWVGVIPAESMGDRIGKLEVLEGTGEKLVVFIRITPPPETVGTVVGPHC